MPLNQRQLAELETESGERPLVIPMSGATSSDLYRLDYRQGRKVLRVFKAERWDASPASLSERELEILSALEKTDLPTPRPAGRLEGNGVLMSFLPGQVHLPRFPEDDWLDRLSLTLARIHRLPATVPYAYESWNETALDGRPQWWDDRRLWLEAQAVTARSPRFERRFIHRDYHPVNLLWEEGLISGVVDWINACMGPVGMDVAHCRLNLALMYGLEAADVFLERYMAHSPGYMHDGFWDIEDALGALPEVTVYRPWIEFGLTELTDELVRQRLQSFVAAAVRSR